MSSLDFLFDSIFLGFGLSVPIVLLLRKLFKNHVNLKLSYKVIRSSVLMYRVAGLLYLVYFIAAIIYECSREEHLLSILNRMFGSFWFFFWINPLVLGIFPQLCWVRKCRKNIGILVSLAILTFITCYYNLLSEGIAIIMIKFMQAYLPSSWAMISVERENLLLKMTLFLILLGLAELMFKKIIKMQRNYFSAKTP